MNASVASTCRRTPPKKSISHPASNPLEKKFEGFGFGRGVSNSPLPRTRVYDPVASIVGKSWLCATRRCRRASRTRDPAISRVGFDSRAFTIKPLSVRSPKPSHQVSSELLRALTSRMAPWYQASGTSVTGEA